MGLTGKRVPVTAGTPGVGHATALALARRGPASRSPAATGSGTRPS
jgi:NAD(P)-dependent dehydrogenase (short-subunit alcohol dehydrogenase family)